MNFIWLNWWSCLSFFSPSVLASGFQRVEFNEGNLQQLKKKSAKSTWVSTLVFVSLWYVWNLCRWCFPLHRAPSFPPCQNLSSAAFLFVLLSQLLVKLGSTGHDQLFVSINQEGQTIHFGSFNHTTVVPPLIKSAEDQPNCLLQGKCQLQVTEIFFAYLKSCLHDQLRTFSNGTMADWSIVQQSENLSTRGLHMQQFSLSPRHKTHGYFKAGHDVHCLHGTRCTGIWKAGHDFHCLHCTR